MDNLNQKLRQIAEEILFCGDNRGVQHRACNELYDFFTALTGINHLSENAEDEVESFLAGGKAICPRNAAHCVADFARTTQFLRGVYAAIIELKKRFPSEKLEILYAGSGPFATLITPLMTQFKPEDFCVTLIDVHERSINAARKVFADSGFENFEADFLQTDANTYEHGRNLHLVICETMQTAMRNEPQAALTLHLAPQIAENGIFIPQKISVEAYLVNRRKEFSFNGEQTPKERINLGEIFTLEAEKKRLSPTEFPTVIVETPPIDLEKFDFMYFTTVSIFDKFGLRERDSSLSYPLLVKDLKEIKGGDRIEFRYVLGSKPDFEYKIFSKGEIL